MIGNPYQQYREQGILTASPMELVVMLYDGCIKQIKLSELHLEAGSYEDANRSLQKAQDIITELSASLDFQYEVSNELVAIYEFILRTLMEINATKETKQIDEVVVILTELRDAWSTVSKTAHTGLALEE